MTSKIVELAPTASIADKQEGRPDSGGPRCHQNGLLMTPPSSWRIRGRFVAAAIVARADSTDLSVLKSLGPESKDQGRTKNQAPSTKDQRWDRSNHSPRPIAFALSPTRLPRRPRASPA